MRAQRVRKLHAHVMGVKFAHALGAHAVVFTTSAGKKEMPCAWAPMK